MDEKKPPTDFELVEKAAKELSEHFDGVQIFANRLENNEGGTINIQYGTGNWFSRYGQIRQWLIKEEEHSKCEARKRHDADEP